MLFTSVPPQSIPRVSATHGMKLPLLSISRCPSERIMTQVRRGQSFFFFLLCFPLLPSISHQRLVSKQAERSGAQLFDRALWREPRSGFEAWAGLKSEFDMAPVQLADLVSVPQSATWLIITLPCFSPTQKANNVQPLTNSTLENGPGVLSRHGSPTPSRRRRCSLNLQSLSSTIGR